MVSINNSVTDILLKGNYFSTSQYCINLGENCFNILVQNNYLHTANGHQLVVMTATSGIMFSNNVIDLSNNSNTFSSYNSVFSNNIFICNYSNSLSLSTNEYYNNISNLPSLPSGNSNQNSVDMSTVINMTGSPDGYYKLKPGSPAIGGGQNGIDIGMFGGISPYVLSGISSLPKIYSLEILNLTPQALTARIKAGATLNQPIPLKKANDNSRNNIAPPVKTSK